MALQRTCVSRSSTSGSSSGSMDGSSMGSSSSNGSMDGSSSTVSCEHLRMAPTRVVVVSVVVVGVVCMVCVVCVVCVVQFAVGDGSDTVLKMSSMVGG